MLILYIILITISLLSIGFITRLSVIRKVEKELFETPLEDEEKQNKAYESGIVRHEFYSGSYKLVGHWLAHSSDAKSVFILHGNGEVASEWLQLQLFLKSKGYNSFVFDYAGFGDSQGTPSINVLRLNTMAAWNEFLALSSTDDRIILSHSLGTAVLLDTVKLLNKPAKKLILHGAFSSARDLSVLFGHLPQKLSRIMPDIWNNVKAIKTLSDFEVKIVHSTGDNKIPYHMGQLLAKQLTSAEFISINSKNHNAIYQTPEEVWKHIKFSS